MDEAGANLHRIKCNRNALKNKIEFYRHNISDIDKEELLKVLESVFLTTGPKVREFEERFAAYTKNRLAVGLMSCTHALELALRYFDIGAGDEVITTPMSFVATTNAIEYVGAKPVFVDVEKNTGNLNAEFIEKAITSRSKAILVVHLYGQMCDMVRIKQIADRHNLKIIEDRAHCIEGMRAGMRQLGDIACYSFYATKNLTCGEGGAITCNDDSIYDWFLQARQHGICKSAADRYQKRYEHYDMEFLGIKSNMSDLQAALMVRQIGSLDGYLAKREMIAKRYDKELGSQQNIKTPLPVKDSVHARHLYTIWVDAKNRDNYLYVLQDLGIGVAVNYAPIHLMSYYRKRYGYKPGDFPEAERIGGETISLPLYPKLTGIEVEHVINSVKAVLGV